MKSKKLKALGLMSLALVGVTGVSVFASTEGTLVKERSLEGSAATTQEVEVSVGTMQRVDVNTGEVTDLDINELMQVNEDGTFSNEGIISVSGGDIKINEDGSTEVLSEVQLSEVDLAGMAEQIIIVSDDSNSK